MINPRFPFGGYKQSGIGREHGELGYNEYREVKHIHVDMTGARQRQPWWSTLFGKPGGDGPPKPETPGSKPGG